MEEAKDIFIDDKLKEVLDKVVDNISKPNEEATVIISAEVKCANPRCENMFVMSTPSNRFCSEPCRLRYNSLIRYNKLKDNQEYKDRVHKKNKRYYEEHKEDLKNRMKEYGRIYYKKKKEKKEKKDGNSEEIKTTS